MTDITGHSIGRYHVIEKLGEGGMAKVYKAYDTHLDCEVAVKVMRPGEADSAQFSKRFRNETRALAQLKHPNIVHVIDYGEYQDMPYLVMEYLVGGTLKDKMGQPMPYQEAARLLAPIADALSYAHSRDFLHRDVKPANILLTESGQAMLADFGIAKLLDTQYTTELTRTGVGVGTPSYMAPEQWLGKAEPRTDQYALGIVFYEMVTGRLPYEADTPAAVLIKHVNDPLPRPGQFVRHLPATVENVIFKALAKEPENRFNSMAEFATVLEKLSHGADVSVGKIPGVPSHQRRNLPVLIGGLGVLGILGLLAILLAISALSGTKLLPFPSSSRPTTSLTDNTQDTLQTPFDDLDSGEDIDVPLATGRADAAGAQSTSAAQSGEMPVTEPTQTDLPEKGPTFTSIPTKKPDTGSSMVSPTDGVTLVYVTAGEFLMGSNYSNQDEAPSHTIYLDAFWIDETEVTVEMYMKCTQAGDCKSPDKFNSYYRSNYFGNAAYYGYPVMYIDWHQAKDYCEWAGRRLATEAEWEKAARGSDGRSYPWGEGIECTHTRYKPCEQDTAPVGNFPAGISPYGAFDMAGNVWEWVSDWYSKSYYSSSSSNNPEGPGGGDYKVMRGGSWFSDEVYTRTTARRWEPPGSSFSSVGIRCALTP